MDRFTRAPAFHALRLDREVDHQDRVFLHDADQEHDADDADDVQPGPREVESQQRADARGGKRRDDGDRVSEAFVEDA
jgi:hypothetical protein